MRRRELVTGMAAAAVCRAIAPDMRLIAHRGGVVDAERPENSAEAITAAIERGYWMIEVDVRRTKDGEPVLHHDSTLKVVPVAAINTFRYTMAKCDETLGTAEDVAKLWRLGVTHYQIDSRYEDLFDVSDERRARISRIGG